MPWRNRILTLAASVLTAHAQSNFDPAHSVLGVESVGVLNFLATRDHGAVVNQFYASGYIQGANVGWISLGSVPADNFQYRNDSATDFGVNVTPAGELRGFAYGANIGWIHFAPAGNPRVDWKTGKLSGRIWAANLGWIELETTSEYLRLGSRAEPVNSDGDGLPDAWEMHHASNLTTLSGRLDSDGDGLSDLGEYLAGTSPVNALDYLFVALTVAANPSGSRLEWPAKDGYLYFIDQRTAFQPAAEWTPANLDPIIGTGGTAALSLPASAAITFYRVRAYPPLSAP